MTDDSHARDRFWTDLAEVRTGLLAIKGFEHAAPMTAHWEDRDALYFFGPANGVLANNVSGSTAGEFLYTGPRHDLYAVVQVALQLVADADTRRRLWSDEVEAWFPGGPDRSDATLIRAELGSTRIWLAEESRPGHDERTTVRIGDGGRFRASVFSSDLGR